MTKIAILGTGPLPIEQDNYIYSSSNRTWQIAKALLEEGHRVHVISFRPTRTKDGVRINDTELRQYSEGEFTLDSVEELTHFRNDGFLRDRIEASGSEAVVGVNVFPASRSAALEPAIPFWADMNGFGMGEVQIRGFLTGNNQAVAQGWVDELPCLVRADCFSSASGPQRYALIGELAAIGRLRPETCGYEFVHVIPEGREDPPPSGVRPTVLDQLPEGAQIALWVGCYNYQFDTDTLFEGMERAMDRSANLHFVSTGGQVDGHNETTFARFKKQVDGSRHKDRFHFVGWLPWDEFDGLLRTAHLGVTLDIPCYETEIGARNRITEMMRVGLPVLSTRGPEISWDLEKHSAGWLVDFSDPDQLEERLVEALSDPAELERRAKNSRKVFEKFYTLSAATAPLLAWAKNPQFAPDRGMRPLLLPEYSKPEKRGWLKGWLG
ncbi:MAG: glycosyltransferase family 4 protein [Candidatus Omnitrophica bacterium]|nr:glycosyltransferase family 4 protein [Candidatus Omnitrophota bacterium]